jgi:hypothetical protein
VLASVAIDQSPFHAALSECNLVGAALFML